MLCVSYNRSSILWTDMNTDAGISRKHDPARGKVSLEARQTSDWTAHAIRELISALPGAEVIRCRRPVPGPKTQGTGARAPFPPSSIDPHCMTN